MRNYILALCLLGTTLYSCKKDEEGNIPGWNKAGASGPDLQSVYLPLAPMEQSFTIDAAATTTVTTTRGIRFTVEASSFTRNAQPVTGNVTLKVREYFTNKDLLTGNLNTGHVDGSLLITGGAFQVTAFTAGDLGVSLIKPMMVSIPERNGNFNTAHQLFTGQIPLSSGSTSILSALSWHTDTTTWRRGQFGNSATYDFPINRLNWWNLDRFVDMGQGTTKLSVKLPANYGNINTTVALLLPENGLVQLSGDADEQAFTSGHYRIPIGMPVKILAISKINGALSYHLHSTTITADETIYVTEMLPTTDAGLTTLIESNLN